MKNQLKIIIVGGGNIGFNLAKDLENFMAKYLSVLLNTNDRAKYVADQLTNTLV